MSTSEHDDSPTRAVAPIGPRVRFAYAAPAFALAVVGIPVYVHLPKFYTDVVGVDVGTLGLILLAVRLFDAVTDPVVGALSDRTRGRLGRRRPFLLVAVVPLALCMWLLFVPPDIGPGAATWWFALGVFSLFLFWTAVTVPYEALGVELSFDFHERTSLLGLRDGALVAGTLAGAASPLVVAGLLSLPPGEAGERQKFLWIASIYAGLLVVLCWTCVAVVRERITGTGTGTGSGGLLGPREALRNRPFAILLASYTVSAFGSNLPATLILYYVEYVLESPDADAFLALYLAIGVLFLPAWIAASRRFGKKPTWIAAMLLNTGAFSGVFFLGPGDVALYGALVVLSGVGMGATLAIPSSMQADVIDYDELRCGQRREGQYVGLWSIARKLAAALGVGVGLALLSLAGYVPNAEQSESVRTTLRVLYALVPTLCSLAAIAIAVGYPIDSDRHAAILRGIAARRRGETPVDPLAAGDDR